MAKNKNQKLRFTYVSKIMQEQTDDDHALTMPEIIDELDKIRRLNLSISHGNLTNHSTY